MDNRILVNQPIQPTKDIKQKQTKENKQTDKANKQSFKEVMARKLQEKSGIKFSKHAKNRLASRSINVSESDLKRLENGVTKAENKGARDSLIMVNKVAYVVSVENKTVITAIDDQNIKENVFTNIDSAVFM